MISKVECDCKIGKLPDEVYRKVQDLKNEGEGLREIVDYVKGEVGEKRQVSIATVSRHFDSCGLEAPKSTEESRLHPQHLARIVEDKIETCDRLIKKEEERGEPDKKVLARLIDTQRRLIDKQLENQQAYLEYQEETPEEVISKFKRMLEEGGLTQTQKLKLLKAFEKDLGFREKESRG